MKTKYILHGGFTPGNQNENNNDFYKEIIKDVLVESRILIVPFAKDVDRIIPSVVRVTAEFNKNKLQKNLSFELANEESFIKQL